MTRDYWKLLVLVRTSSHLTILFSSSCLKSVVSPTTSNPLKTIVIRSFHQTNKMFKDTVFINNLAATAITGKDAWNRPTPQPITITASLKTDFQQASITDNLKYSLNYAVLSRNIAEYMKINEHKNFKSLGNIGESLSKVLLDEKKGGGFETEVTIQSKKSEIRADSIEYKLFRSKLNDSIIPPDEIKVNGLKLLTIIGVFTFERLQKQIVDIDLNIILKPSSSVIIHKIIDEVTLYVESSNFKTVEALVMKIGQLIFQNHSGEGIERISTKVTKPNAITFTDGVGVSSTDMTESSFIGLEPISVNEYSNISNFNLPTNQNEGIITNKEHIAYIAFGSNQGNQLKNINDSIDLLKNYNIKVLSTSCLYVSKPMYYKDQADFYNGVLKISCYETPHDLLKILKEIEYNHINRIKEFDNGPREIDLDILLYDDISINTPNLTIPHKSMLERTFVLQPLCELIAPDTIHPVSAEPIHDHSKQLIISNSNEQLQESSRLLQITPIPRLKENVLKFDQIDHKLPTVVMGILNVTPDSFSDGGKNYNLSEDQIIKTCHDLVKLGANIIDIGGVSTRPGSQEPTEEEELKRVLPIIKLIRSSNVLELENIILSIDTYRSKVAEECLLAGADIINDISMGLYDGKIFEVVAKFGCPYIMNHTRGNLMTMSKLTNYESNMNEDLIEFFIDPVNGQQEYNKEPPVTNLINGISREVSLQMLKAFNKGVKKWQIIMDPGIGFAKNLPQNLMIIKNATDFKKYSLLSNVTDVETNETQHSYVSFNGLPTLLGPSRKKFLGTICQESKPSDRLISTSASIMACIEQNANIVRVHDVEEMKKVCLTGDAIYKGIY